jgi:hypothetical protein
MSPSRTRHAPPFESNTPRTRHARHALRQTCRSARHDSRHARHAADPSRHRPPLVGDVAREVGSRHA